MTRLYLEEPAQHGYKKIQIWQKYVPINFCKQKRISKTNYILPQNIVILMLSGLKALCGYISQNLDFLVLWNVVFEDQLINDYHNVLWKSDLTDKMNRSFFQAAVVSILLYGCTTWTLTSGEEARRQLHKNTASNTEQVLAATPHKAPTIQPPTSHHENYPS